MQWWEHARLARRRHSRRYYGGLLHTGVGWVVVLVILRRMLKILWMLRVVLWMLLWILAVSGVLAVWIHVGA
jgi:hypothetical protein